MLGRVIRRGTSAPRSIDRATLNPHELFLVLGEGRQAECGAAFVDSGEVSAVNVAYLTDRVRMHEGKPQVYGTQFRRSNGDWEPYPIEDPDRVDERRAALGLATLAEYKKQLMRFQDKSD